MDAEGGTNFIPFFSSTQSGEVATTSSPTATPVTTEASPSGGHALSAYTKLFGFGMNSFGLFSIFAVINDASGTLYYSIVFDF